MIHELRLQWDIYSEAPARVDPIELTWPGPVAELPRRYHNQGAVGGRRVP